MGKERSGALSQKQKQYWHGVQGRIAEDAQKICGGNASKKEVSTMTTRLFYGSLCDDWMREQEEESLKQKKV